MTINVTNVEPLRTLRVTTENGTYMRVWLEGESGTTYRWFEHREHAALDGDGNNVWVMLPVGVAAELDLTMALPISQFVAESAKETMATMSEFKAALAALFEELQLEPTRTENKQ